MAQRGIRAIDVAVREAEERVRRGGAPRLIRELLAHLRQQIEAGLELAMRAKHRDICELATGGFVTDRNGDGRPIMMRHRTDTDPPAACTCGLTEVVARIPRALVAPPKSQ